MEGIKEEILKRGLGEVLEGVPMRRLTSFRIGGPVMLIRPSEEEALGELLCFLWEAGIDVKVLGGGTNLLVSDAGLRDTVVLDLGSLPKDMALKDGILVCTAPVRLGELLRLCAQRGLKGLEELSGIPGTVGGAVKGNAGAWGREIGELVEYLVIYDRKGQKKLKKRGEFSFSYRQGPLAEGEVLWEVGLRLEEGDAQEIGDRMAQILAERRKRQPLDLPSAGCIFKNPPAAPPAGYLIEKVGLKGHRKGGAQVSEVHANFIVNRGGATFSDVMGLIEEMREKVFEAFGIELELEVQVWN